MKKVLCSFLLIAAILCTAVLPASAAKLPPDEQLAAAFLEAVEQEQSVFHFEPGGEDMLELTKSVFTKYPVLYFYYGGYDWTGNTANVKLSNTHVPWDDISIIRSAEEAKTVIQMGLLELREQVYFVAVDGFLLDDDTLVGSIDGLMEESYLSYMGYQGYTYSYSSWDNLPISSYTMTYNYWEGTDPQQLAGWREDTEQAAIHLSETLFALDMPDYMRELRIHDWLVENNRYNSENMDAPSAHMAYSALVDGRPVCQGYTEAMLVLAQAADIPCRYVDGSATNSDGTDSHSWNCVEIGGQWYMLDITWDDPIMNDGSQVLQHDYFNVTSQTLAQNHQWAQGEYPNCTAQEMDAETVRALCESDTNTYTRYTSEKLVTRDKMRAILEPQLAKLAAAVPGEAPVTDEVEETPAEEAGWETAVPEEEAVVENTEAEAVVEEVEVETEERETEPAVTEGSSGGTLTILLIGGGVLLVAVILIVILLLLRKKKSRSRTPDYMVFDPTKPFY